jgi:hypothetical protein
MFREASVADCSLFGGEEPNDKLGDILPPVSVQCVAWNISPDRSRMALQKLFGLSTDLLGLLPIGSPAYAVA